MRLITYTVGGVKLFSGPVRIDLYATSMVRNNSMDVSRCSGNGSRICTETLLAFTGLNATGKTTLLRMFDFVANLVSGVQLDGHETGQVSLQNLVGESGLDVSAIFEHGGQWYLLKSRVLPLAKRSGEPAAGFWPLERWRIEDEFLYRHADKVIAKKELGDTDAFKANSVLDRHRADLGPDMLAALGPGKSVTALLGMEPALLLNFDDMFTNPADPIPTTPAQIAKVFDPSVRKLELDGDGQVHLQFERDGREHEVSPLLASLMLSAGTVRGARLMQSVVAVLQAGGYLVIDEIENSLHKKLLQTLLDLFARPLTNPHGALLVFSTHYPELLDYMPRTDDIYFTRRSEAGAECVKLSTLGERVEPKRSDMLLGNLFGGTVPKAADLAALRGYVREQVGGGAPDERK